MAESTRPTAQQSHLLGYHIRRTISLGLPIMIARSAIILMPTVDAIMTGWAGARELAILGLGVAPYLTLFIIAIGALQPAVILTAQSVGAGRTSDVGAIWRCGLFQALIFGVAVFATSLFAEPFFILTGQDPDISGDAASVSRAFAFASAGMLLFIATNLVLEATDRPKISMVVMLAANVLNIPLNGIFVLGWGGFADPGGAFEATMVSAVLRWLAFITILAIFIRHAALDGDCLKVFLPFGEWMSEWSQFGGRFARPMWWMGFPLGLMRGLEAAAFALVVFMAGRLGAEILAAHQATQTVITLAVMIALGMAGATSIRVGNAVGASNRANVRAAGAVGIALSFAIAAPLSVIAIVFPGELIGLFVDDPMVISIGTGTMRAAGWIFTIDAMMVVSLGALRGAGDIWMPFLLQAIAFWVTGIPAAWFFAFHLGVGPVGLWWGIGIGICAAVILLVSRFAIVSTRPVHER